MGRKQIDEAQDEYVIKSLSNRVDALRLEVGFIGKANEQLQAKNKRMKKALAIAMQFIDTSPQCASMKTRFEIEQALKDEAQ